jgi:hypothetical protein
VSDLPPSQAVPSWYSPAAHVYAAPPLSHVAHVCVSDVPPPSQAVPFWYSPVPQVYAAPPLSHVAHVCVSDGPLPSQAVPSLYSPVGHPYMAPPLPQSAHTVSEDGEHCTDSYCPLTQDEQAWQVSNEPSFQVSKGQGSLHSRFACGMQGADCPSPAGHVVEHDWHVKLSVVNMPDEHSVHSSSPCKLTDPAGQGSHLVLSTSNSPARHASHIVAPGPLTYPGSQGWQVVPSL